MDGRAQRDGSLRFANTQVQRMHMPAPHVQESTDIDLGANGGHDFFARQQPVLEWELTLFEFFEVFL